jgi:hypothetical protein
MQTFYLLIIPVTCIFMLQYCIYLVLTLRYEIIFRRKPEWPEFEYLQTLPFYHKLTVDEWKEFINEFNAQATINNRLGDSGITDLKNLLALSITWSKTLKGHDYWASIAKR